MSVGFTALQASMTAEEWQTADKEVSLTIHTQTLDDAPQAAKGIGEDLPAPATRPRAPAPLRREFASEYDSGRRGIQLADSDGAAPPDLSNVNAWPLGEMVAEREFATDVSGLAQQSFPLMTGPYRVILETADSFGKPVTAVLPLTVLDPQAQRLDIKVSQLVAAHAGVSSRVIRSPLCGVRATKKDGHSSRSNTGAR